VDNAGLYGYLASHGAPSAEVSRLEAGREQGRGHGVGGAGL